MQPQSVAKTNSGKRRESDFKSCHIRILKMYSKCLAFKKCYKLFKETRMYGPYTVKIKMYTQCIWGSLNIVLSRQRLTQLPKYAQRLKDKTKQIHIRRIMGEVRMMSHQMENINRKIEVMKSNQIEILGLKITITEIKHSLERLIADLSR